MSVKIISFAATALVCILAGCCWVNSIEGLADDKTVVFDSRLVGHWSWSGGSACDDGRRTHHTCSLAFARASSNSYTIEFRNRDGDRSVFTARIADFGDVRILDVEQPPEGVDERFDKQRFRGTTLTYLLHSVSTHTFWKVEIDSGGSTLRLTPLGMEWARDLADKLKLPHYSNVGEDVLLLTAKSDELRETLAKHLGDPKAFDSRETLLWSKQ